MLYVMSKLASLKSDRRGVTALEYAVIAAVIIGVVASTFTSMGTLINSKLAPLLTILG